VGVRRPVEGGEREKVMLSLIWCRENLGNFKKKRKKICRTDKSEGHCFYFCSTFIRYIFLFSPILPLFELSFLLDEN